MLTLFVRLIVVLWKIVIIFSFFSMWFIWSSLAYDFLLVRLFVGSSCCVQVWVICFTSDEKVEVEHFIYPITLRFWVRMWCLSHLCGCSGLDVGGPSGSPRDPTDVSELWFNEGFDQLFVSKVLLTKGVQATGSVVCRDNGDTSINVCGWKSFRIRGDHDEWWTLHGCSGLDVGGPHGSPRDPTHHGYVGGPPDSLRDPTHHGYLKYHL